MNDFLGAGSGSCHGGGTGIGKQIQDSGILTSFDFLPDEIPVGTLFRKQSGVFEIGG